MKIIETSGDERYSIVGLVDEIPTTLNANLLGVLHAGWKHQAYFLPDGRKVTLSATSGHEIKNRPLSIFLANTLYNPRRKVKVAHVEAGSYSIEDLTRSILSWVEKDDDILLQFIGEDDIQMLLARAETYEDLVFAVRAINGDFEGDESFKQELVAIGMTWLVEEE